MSTRPIQTWPMGLLSGRLGSWLWLFFMGYAALHSMSDDDFTGFLHRVEGFEDLYLMIGIQ